MGTSETTVEVSQLYTSLSKTHFLYSISFLFSYKNGWGLGKHVGYPLFNFIGNWLKRLKPNVWYVYS
jgi:hypothetical protein